MRCFKDFAFGGDVFGGPEGGRAIARGGPARRGPKSAKVADIEETSGLEYICGAELEDRLAETHGLENFCGKDMEDKFEEMGQREAAGFQGRARGEEE